MHDVCTPISLIDLSFKTAGSMTDGELSLVQPQEKYLGELMTAIAHPRTQSEAREVAGTTTQQVREFFTAAPFGQYAGDPVRGRLPGYTFWMRSSAQSGLPIRIVGGIGLRLGDTPDLRNYLGHIGYNVYPAARGRRYAARACKLLFPLARAHGFQELWITCNPDNFASRRTCEQIGGVYVSTVKLPDDHPLAEKGEHYKCRYRIAL